MQGWADIDTTAEILVRSANLQTENLNAQNQRKEYETELALRIAAENRLEEVERQLNEQKLFMLTHLETKAKIAKLENDLNTSEAARNEAEERVTQQAASAESETKLKELETRLAENDDKLAEMRLQFQNAEKQRIEAETARVAADSEREEAKRNNLELLERSGTTLQLLEQVRTERDELKQKLEEEGQVNETLKAKYEALAGHMTQLRSAVMHNIEALELGK